MLSHNGLTKLAEELAEALQVTLKLKGLRDSGNNNQKEHARLLRKLQDELADVKAISSVVEENFSLDRMQMHARLHAKSRKYRRQNCRVVKKAVNLLDQV